MRRFIKQVANSKRHLYFDQVKFAASGRLTKGSFLRDQKTILIRMGKVLDITARTNIYRDWKYARARPKIH